MGLVREDMFTVFGDHPWTLVFPMLAAGALAADLIHMRRGVWLRAFGASSLIIVGLLTSMAAGLYPDILPAREGDLHSLTIDNAAAGHDSLMSALVWWPFGMLLAAVYFVFAYRMFCRADAPQAGSRR